MSHDPLVCFSAVFSDLTCLCPHRVHKHTIPYFVPVEELATKHMENSISDFLDEVSEYVQVKSVPIPVALQSPAWRDLESDSFFLDFNRRL